MRSLCLLLFSILAATFVTSSCGFSNYSSAAAQVRKQLRCSLISGVERSLTRETWREEDVDGELTSVTSLDDASLLRRVRRPQRSTAMRHAERAGSQRAARSARGLIAAVAAAAVLHAVQQCEARHLRARISTLRRIVAIK